MLVPTARATSTETRRLPAVVLVGVVVLLMTSSPWGGFTGDSPRGVRLTHPTLADLPANRSGSPPLPTLGVNGSYPLYDPTDGAVYVSCPSNGTVLVLNGSSRQLAAPPIPVGSYPSFLALDSRNGYLYVVTAGAGPWSGVTVVDTATDLIVPSNILVGGKPAGIAFDPQNGFIYVSNWFTNNISVINGSSNHLIGPAIWMPDAGALAYDPQTGDLYVGTGGYAGGGGVIDTSSNVVENDTQGAAGFESVAFDVQTGDLYGRSWGGPEVYEINGTTESTTTIYDRPSAGGVTVEGNTGWVIIGAQVLVAASGTFLEPFLPYSVGGGAYDPATGWIFSAGSPMIAVHDTRLYQLQFVATGIPNGTDWSVALGNYYWDTSPGADYITQVGNHSFSNALVMTTWNGSYSYEVMPVPGHTYNRFGTATVDGHGASVNVPFGVFEFLVTFDELGLPTGTPWNISVTGGSLTGPRVPASTGTSVTAELANGSYTEDAAALGYVSSSGPMKFVVNGSSPANQTILFNAAPGVGIPAQNHQGSGLTLVEIAVALAAASLALAAVAFALVLRGRRPPLATDGPPRAKGPPP